MPHPSSLPTASQIDGNELLWITDDPSGVPVDRKATVDQVLGRAPTMTGATGSADGARGMVPAPTIADRNRVLRGDGTWADQSVSGSAGLAAPAYDSVALLKAAPLLDYSTPKVAQVRGFHADLPGRGNGFFIWDPLDGRDEVAGYIIRPNHAASTTGRLVRVCVNNELSLYDTGARGDVVMGTTGPANLYGPATVNSVLYAQATDDSAAINVAINAAQGLLTQSAVLVPNQPFRRLRIPAARFRVSVNRLAPIQFPIGIQGDSPGTSILFFDDQYTGPALEARQLFGLDSLGPNYRGGGVWRDFKLAGRRQNRSGVDLTIGTQHGIWWSAQNDCVSLENVFVEDFRGIGIASGWGITNSNYAGGTAWLRELAWRNVRVRRCGAGDMFPSWAFYMDNVSQDESNELFFSGCQISLSCGPMRFRSRNGRKSGTLIHFHQFEHHCFNNALAPEVDCLPTVSRPWDLVEMNGDLLGIYLEQTTWNASKRTDELTALGAVDPQWMNTGRIYNEFRYPVSVAENCLTVTNGSRDFALTLPTLPTWALGSGGRSVRTIAGSPFLYFTLPGHSLTKGDWISPDSFSGTTRSTTVYQWDGLAFAGDCYVEGIMPNGEVVVNPMRGVALVGGTVSTTITIKQTYGLNATATTPYGSPVSFDTFQRGKQVGFAQVVGGATITGNYGVKSMTGFNELVIRRDNSTVPTSNATSAFTSPQVWLNSDMTGPGTIRVEGRAATGAAGWRVDAGNDIDIACLHTPTEPDGVTGFAQPDLYVGNQIRGFVRYHGRAGARIVKDPSIEHLVIADAAPERNAPIRGVSIKGGFMPHHWVDVAPMLGIEIAGAATRRPTEDGSATADIDNVRRFLHAGGYQLTGTVAVTQYGGSVGNVGDSARWDFKAGYFHDGTPAGTTCQHVNNDAANVGVSLPPDFASSGMELVRLTITHDQTFGAPQFSVAGVINRNISVTVAWNEVYTAPIPT